MYKNNHLLKNYWEFLDWKIPEEFQLFDFDSALHILDDISWNLEAASLQGRTPFILSFIYSLSHDSLCYKVMTDLKNIIPCFEFQDRWIFVHKWIAKYTPLFFSSCEDRSTSFSLSWFIFTCSSKENYNQQFRDLFHQEEYLDSKRPDDFGEIYISVVFLFSTIRCLHAWLECARRLKFSKIH